MFTSPADYAIAPVSHPVDERLRREVGAFWLGNGALPSIDEAKRRADELVCVARNAAGEIVAVNTAYVARQPGEEDPYYVYRMFVRPRDRHLHLALAMMRAAVAALRTRRSEPVVRGALLVTENQKLMRACGRRVLANLGWHRTGVDGRGFDVWRIEFE